MRVSASTIYSESETQSTVRFSSVLYGLIWQCQSFDSLIHFFKFRTKSMRSYQPRAHESCVRHSEEKMGSLEHNHWSSIKTANCEINHSMRRLILYTLSDCWQCSAVAGYLGHVHLPMSHNSETKFWHLHISFALPSLVMTSISCHPFHV